MHQTAIRLALLGLCGWLPPAMKPAPLNPVSAPLVYEETMLVLVSKDGVAAVVFRATGDGTASYDYRFESKDGTETETGTRPLTERKDAAGRYVGEQFIKAGPIVVEWSQGDPKKGWIYYTPSTVKIHPALASQFAKLDLKLFLK